jgi:hypothetical protein
MKTCAAGYALIYVTTLKLRLVSWMIVSLTTAKCAHLVSSLYNLCKKCYFKEVICCCVFIHCCRNVFIEPLPNKKEPSAWGYNWSILFLGDKYGDLALQVCGVSDEMVKYGREFCGTLTQEWVLWQGPEVNYRPVLLSEMALQNNKPVTV